MTVDAERLQVWGETLCRLTAADAGAAATALGIPGSVVRRSDQWDVEPPPPGTARLMLVAGPDGIGHLDVLLAGSAVTRADLDARFGSGRDIPRAGPGRPHRLAYHVAPPGAPFTCELFACFAEEPAAATPANEVILRRDRVSAPRRP